MNINSIRSLSDDQLLRDVEVAAAHECQATAQLIALLAEMDTRRLYLQQGYSSLFVYCTQCLHLSEHAAYGRIEAARAARKFPVVLERLADGSITLTTICLLSNHLSGDNDQELLNAARHKSRRDVEEQIAALRPMNEISSAVRRLPQPLPATSNVMDDLIKESAAVVVGSAAAPATNVEPLPVRPPVPSQIRPLAPERYKVQFTIGAETHRKLRALQDLMRHVVPNGDIAEIFDRAIALLLRDVERRRFADVKRQRLTDNVVKASGRHLPASVKREVWARDQGQCAFVGVKGRCGERGFLEFHHVIPFADGGATTTENLQLRCRAHNAYEARERFGLSLLRESW